MRKTLAWERPTYTLYGEDVCYGVSPGEGFPPIDGTPVPLADGSMLHPGESLVAVGGKRTSAGFVNFRMADGHCLEYCGSVPGEDCEEGKRLLLFKECGPDGVVRPTAGGEWVAWLELKPGRWFFTSRGCASRIVDTVNAVRAEKGGNCIIRKPVL
jgi:hypothetical protein